MVKVIGSVVALFVLFAGLTQIAAAQTKTADETLKDRVEYRLETNATTRKYDIKVRAAAGKVTLTGDVATEAQKAEAAKVAKIKGVTEVDNQIKVDANTDRTLAERAEAGLNKAGQKITDAWITTKVKWFIIGDDLLDGSDINVDTANRVVTLKGTVKTEAGRARAIALAKDTDGVTRVVDQLKIG